MPRYVIGPDVALHLAGRETVVAAGHQLVAPTLIRSQLLSRLYRAVRDGTMTEAEAERRLDYVRTLRLRLLGDRVLQQVAWRIAFQLGWSDTLDAEYVALTRLQADAFITLDRELARAVEGVVATEGVEALSRPAAS
jgi:predicted nucleic acid-binding protein